MPKTQSSPRRPARRAPARRPVEAVRLYDPKKELPQLYRGSSRVEEVQSPKATYLVVEGHSAPGSDEFSRAFELLFSVAYTLKFTLKAAGTIDFKVSAPECFYLAHPPQWHWLLASRIPKEATARHVAAARAEIKRKRSLDMSAVRRLPVTEGRCLQVLHVGPYDDLGRAYAALAEAMPARGLEAAGMPHEVYLNDPRRVPPARLKTIIRWPVKKAVAS